MFTYKHPHPKYHILLNPADRYRTEINLTFTAAGGYFEQDREKGLYHLLEHCMVKQTSKYNVKAFRKYLFANDIYLNAATGITSLSLTISGHKDLIQEMLDIVLEMAFVPVLSESVLAQERAIVLREINERRGTPAYRLNKLIQKKTLEKNSRNMIDSLGNSENVEQANIEILYKLHERMYTNSHIVLTVSGGGIEPELVESKFIKYFTEDETCLPINYDLKNVYKPFSYMPIVSKLAHEQVDLEIIIPCEITFENLAERVTLYKFLLNPPHGILFEKLRNELGHVYHVDGAFYSSSSSFNIFVTCEPERVSSIIFEVKKVFNSFNEILNEEDLTMLKSILVKQQELSQDNPQESIEFTENKLYGYGIFSTLDEFIEQLKSISITEIHSVFTAIKNNLPDMKVVAVSNNKSIYDLDILGSHKQ